MSRLAVSCCGYGGGLFVIDLHTGEVLQITRSGGTMGFCFGLDHWWVLDYSMIRMLDPEFNLVQMIDIERPFPWADSHDVAFDDRDGALFVATTASNAVEKYAIRMPPRSPGEARLERIGALFLDAPYEDRLHLNSLAVCDHGLFVSMLSATGRTDQNWASASNGAIGFMVREEMEQALVPGELSWKLVPGHGFAADVSPPPNLFSPNIVLRGLNHPHSVSVGRIPQPGPRLYFCESKEKVLSSLLLSYRRSNDRILPVTGGALREVQRIPMGYARGQAVWEEDGIIRSALGSSNSRNDPPIGGARRAHTATIHVAGTQGEREYKLPGAFEVFQITHFTW